MKLKRENYARNFDRHTLQVMRMQAARVNGKGVPATTIAPTIVFPHRRCAAGSGLFFGWPQGAPLRVPQAHLMIGETAPVLLVVDGHAVHHSKAVCDLVTDQNGKLALCFLPPNSPQLNSGESNWSTSSAGCRGV